MFSQFVCYLMVLLCNGFADGIVCQDGWVTYHESCYLFARNHRSSFTEAEHYCSQHGGHLVEMETKEENLFIKDFLRGMQGENHWIGLTDEMVEGIWQWYTSKTVASFTGWCPGEPNSYHKEEDCVALWSSCDYGWFDVPCDGSDQAEPICEVKSGEVDVGIVG